MSDAAEVVCDIPAPPEEVYRGWLDPEAIRHWLAPHQFRVFELDTDPREGGYYRALIGDESNQEAVIGTYVRLSAGRALRFSWAWPGLDPADWSHVDVQLSPIEGGTRVVLHHDGHHSDAQRQSRVRAWTSCLEKLSGWLQARSPEATSGACP